MKKRREVIKSAEKIYKWLQKNKTQEYTIYRISKEMRTRYETAEKCLTHLKKFNLIQEREGDKKRHAERLFRFKR